MSVFVDTSAFIALIDADNMEYPKARGLWTELLERRESLVTSNYIIVETCALLHNRIGLPAVRFFLETLLPAVLIEWIDVSVHTMGISSLMMSSRKGPNIVDCTSFAVMRKLGIRKAFTLDRHFSDQGFEILTSDG
jgi:uncharacterized protein